MIATNAFSPNGELENTTKHLECYDILKGIKELPI